MGFTRREFKVVKELVTRVFEWGGGGIRAK